MRGPHGAPAGPHPQLTAGWQLPSPAVPTAPDGVERRGHGQRQQQQRELLRPR